MPWGTHLKEYIQKNDISLVDFAKFIQAAHEGESQAWQNAHVSISDYFAGEKGERILKGYLENGISEEHKSKETYDALANLMILYSSMNNAVNRLVEKYGDSAPEHFSERQKLYVAAVEKINEDQQKYNQASPNSLANVIAAFWKKGNEK